MLGTEHLEHIAVTYGVREARVAYEDQANPRRVGTVIDLRAGQFCVEFDDGETTWSDLRQYGWRVA